MTNPTPDQIASGVTDQGEHWSIARFGTLVVTVIDDQDEDTQLATVEDAIAEFEYQVGAVESDES